ncbi:MAG TPA: Rrf2 family transcriptional regulator [Firmicutes bacterium]|nr:Rrf2 family transcriptional regulator [Bacillota bacterium]
MFSQTVEYALRAMVHLAEAAPAPRTNREISAATRVPLGYLAKVMQSLARAGLVVSQRGIGGGFGLTRPPQEITIYDVVQAVDPLKRITRCPLGLPAHSERLCTLHRRLDEAIAMVERSFRETSLADLTAKEGTFPGCDGPGVGTLTRFRPGC